MSIQAQSETLNFQTEVTQLLKLVTHSLYSNSEIFLRELISNASDAADKLRFEALGDNALFENDSELKIWVTFDKDAKTITIRDNAIGMSREEVIDHLGTIAKSGTAEFLKNLTQDKAKDSQLIGKFGVGFYSAFVVADKVVVKTRRAGMKADQGVYWESNGEGQFTVENREKANRGTEIILHLKKDAEEFLDSFRLRNIITKYSDHISLPIVMEEEEEKDGNKTLVEKTVNQAQALWTLPKSKIKDEQYRELYKHIAHDFEDPLIWSHNKVEGKLEYTSLLYVPQRAPFDLWNRESVKGIKLYVKRVFIMDDAEQLLPVYLRFVKGIVDSNDLPLNVSREILQNSQVIEKIRTACSKRVLDMLEKLAQDDSEKYQKFWKNFGQVLKEGPAEDYANRESIAKLLRFASTHQESAEQTISLDDYISRMKPGQDKIYFITADSFAAAKNSPHLEIFKQKNIEVLLLFDRIDEWLMSHLNEYAGKQFQSVAKGDIAIDKVEGEQKAETTKEDENTTKEMESVLKQLKEVLAEKVKEVRISHRLTDSPACLVAAEEAMSLHLQNMLKAAGQEVPDMPMIFEINPKHALIQRLKSETDDARFRNWAEILYNQSLLAQGAVLKDPGQYVKQINQLLLELAKD